MNYKSEIINRAIKNQFTLIAEIGVNYYDIASKERITLMSAARKMIDEAKNAGIHAVKFQSYKASTLASKNSPSYWDLTEESTTSQFELFKKFDVFGQEEYRELKKYCDYVGIEFLSTAFDFESVDYLDEIMDVYKISSSDLNNIPFVIYQAKKNKPMIVSTGASTFEEIQKTLLEIRKYNMQPIILMHCVLEYPTPYDHANLNKIVSLKERFKDVIIGYSDHTKPDKSADIIKTAYNLGAVVVEKHFTLDKTLKGNDHYHSMDPNDGTNIIEGIEFINKIRGNYDLTYLDTEIKSRLNARRSIVSKEMISKGAVVTEEMFIYKRPGTGLAPDQLKEILGKKALVKIEGDEIIKREMFE
ncbi:N-acetylneuraminate synthase family protein [Solibacillus sp. FSL W7-1472]|uniref:N-acetylneuraminate synthase family protein n=1 Tax=Solibacillus sp. FSL W7-1472 TaxID=2921707 RepID=UPI0030D74FB2